MQYYGTYLEVTHGNLTHASEITQDSGGNDSDLRKQVREIATAQKKMESSINSTISTIVSTQIAPCRDK